MYNFSLCDCVEFWWWTLHIVYLKRSKVSIGTVGSINMKIQNLYGVSQSERRLMLKNPSCPDHSCLPFGFQMRHIRIANKLHGSCCWLITVLSCCAFVCMPNRDLICVTLFLSASVGALLPYSVSAAAIKQQTAREVEHVFEIKWTTQRQSGGNHK